MRLPSSEQRIFFERAVSQYQTDLSASTSAQAYLLGRGIGPETAATFRLGVVDHPLLGHEQFRGRLCIPYLTPSGVVTFTFRCLRNHVCKDTVLFVAGDKEHRCRKYMAPEGEERTLFNVNAFKAEGDVIYVCEGEMDAITLTVCGFPAIAIPGVKQWKPHFTRCFADYQDGGQIYCVADGDDAGRQLSRFLAAEIKARPVRPPRGEDCNSIYVQGGEDGIRRWLQGAVS